ncbi:MAG: hypothetical protein ACRC7O_15095, partial [Fimbriiglobus sp.]
MATAPGNKDRVTRTQFDDEKHNRMYTDSVYDTAGNLVASITGFRNSNTPISRAVYTYDHRNRLVKVTQDRYTGSPGGRSNWARMTEVVYRYDGDDNLIGRYEVWKSPPSPVVTMGGEFSRGGQDRYGNPITIPAGYQNSDRTAWPARTFRYVYDRDQIAGYYHDGGLWTRQVWGPGTD